MLQFNASETILASAKRHFHFHAEDKAFNIKEHSLRNVTEEEVMIQQQRILWFVVLLMIAISLTLIFIPKVVKRSFAVTTYRVGVYWDAACTQDVRFIDWGELVPGASRSTKVYIRNEELSPSAYIAFTTQNWTPPSADRYISITWNYIGKPIPFSQINTVTLTLRVAGSIVDVRDFNFLILIVGAENPVGDLNGNGKIDLYDIVIVATAYLTTSTDTNWRPDADLNGDGVIDMADCHFFYSTYNIL
jgi:hypothetical protein